MSHSTVTTPNASGPSGSIPPYINSYLDYHDPRGNVPITDGVGPPRGDYNLTGSGAPTETGSTQVFITPLSKTCIIGRMSDFIEVPEGTKKIRVTKQYTHVPGVNDLIWEGNKIAEGGSQYISDAMVTGLNLMLYPILVDDDNNKIDTSIDHGSDQKEGTLIIKGMDFLETPNDGHASITANVGIQNLGGSFDENYTYLQGMSSNISVPLQNTGVYNPYSAGFVIEGATKNYLYNKGIEDGVFWYSTNRTNATAVILHPKSEPFIKQSVTNGSYDEEIKYNNIKIESNGALQYYINDFLSPSYRKTFTYLLYLFYNRERLWRQTIADIVIPTYPGGPEEPTIITPGYENVNYWTTSEKHNLEEAKYAESEYGSIYSPNAEISKAYIIDRKIIEILKACNSDNYRLTFGIADMALQYNNVPANAMVNLSIYANYSNNRRLLIYSNDNIGETRNPNNSIGSYNISIPLHIHTLPERSIKYSAAPLTSPKRGVTWERYWIDNTNVDDILGEISVIPNIHDVISKKIKSQDQLPAFDVTVPKEELITPTSIPQHSKFKGVKRIAVGNESFTVILTLATGERVQTYLDRDFNLI